LRFLSVILRPPHSSLFPYTTLFRSPVAFFLFNASQREIKTLDQTSRYSFNPSGNIRYTIDHYNEININGNRSVNYSNANNFYNAHIVNTYGNIQRYKSNLLTNTNFRSGFQYSYRNVVKAYFATASYQYTQGKRDYIFQHQFSPLGQSQINILNRESTNYNHSLAIQLSRLFMRIKTTVKLSGNLSYGESDYLLNDVMGKQQFNTYGGNLEIMNNKWDALGFEYNTTFTYSENNYANAAKNDIRSNNHFLNIMIYLVERHRLTINNAYYQTNIKGLKDQYFLDISYRYRVERWKTDIEISGQNLLNKDRYTQQFSTDYQLVETYFDLRPRQVVVSTRFRF